MNTKHAAAFLCLSFSSLVLGACGPEPRGAPLRPPAKRQTSGPAEAAGPSQSAAVAVPHVETSFADAAAAPPAALAGLPLQESPKTWADLQALQTSRGQCTASQGTWHAALLSCRCPTGQVFVLHSGCQAVGTPRGEVGCESPLARLPAEQQMACARSLMVDVLHLNLDLALLKPSAARALLRTLDTAPATLLTGFTVPPSTGTPLYTLSNRLGAVLPAAASRWLQQDGFATATHVTVPWEPVPAPRQVRNRTKACFDALSPSSPEAKVLCAAAATTRNTLAASATRWTVNLFGDDGGRQHILNAQIFAGPVQATYRVHLQGELPLQRQLILDAPTGARLQLLIAPHGGLDAATLSTPSGERTHYNARWQRLEVAAPSATIDFAPGTVPRTDAAPSDAADAGDSEVSEDNLEHQDPV